MWLKSWIDWYGLYWPPMKCTGRNQFSKLGAIFEIGLVGFHCDAHGLWGDLHGPCSVILIAVFFQSENAEWTPPDDWICTKVAGCRKSDRIRQPEMESFQPICLCSFPYKTRENSIKFLRTHQYPARVPSHDKNDGKNPHIPHRNGHQPPLGGGMIIHVKIHWRQLHLTSRTANHGNASHKKIDDQVFQKLRTIRR